MGSMGETEAQHMGSMGHSVWDLWGKLRHSRRHRPGTALPVPPPGSGFGRPDPMGWTQRGALGVPSPQVTLPTISLWSIVSQMAPEEFGGIFAEFPRSLRCVLGEWLENQPW